MGADHYVAANPDDGAFHPNAITELVRMMQAHHGRALIGTIEFPCRAPQALRPRSPSRPPGLPEPVLMIPRALFETVGAFDEVFFMYLRGRGPVLAGAGQWIRRAYLPVGVVPARRHEPAARCECPAHDLQLRGHSGAQMGGALRRRLAGLRAARLRLTPCPTPIPNRFPMNGGGTLIFLTTSASQRQGGTSRVSSTMQVDCIVRFHDIRRLAELKHCVFSLVGQHYRPLPHAFWSFRDFRRPKSRPPGERWPRSSCFRPPRNCRSIIGTKTGPPTPGPTC